MLLYLHFINEETEAYKSKFAQSFTAVVYHLKCNEVLQPNFVYELVLTALLLCSAMPYFALAMLKHIMYG